jgi:hypothetical protein
MSPTPHIEPHTTAWNAQSWLSFGVSLTMTLGGVAMLPVDWWTRGYLLMGTVFLVASSFTLAKTLRDNHEAAKLRNRISSAKADALLKEFEAAA